MLPTTTERNTSVVNPNESWGSEGTSTKDLLVSKIQVVQANSTASKEGIGLAGEIIVYPTNEVIAKKGECIEFLPIICVASWTISEVIIARDGSKELKFMRKEPLTPKNDSDRWKQEDFEDGIPVEKQKCLSYLVLLVNRLGGFPFFIDFQKTNKNAGKLLSTIIQENRLLGKPAPARTILVNTQPKTYKNNSWFAFGLTPGRAASPEEIAACKKWYDEFAASKIQEVEEPREDDGVL